MVIMYVVCVFFFKQKTAYELRISDWSSDVCSSDLQIEDGKGQLECLFFRDAFIEYGAMISRDRVLVIEGSMSDDDFSGGFSLRAKRCWDYRELCAAGQRLDLRIDRKSTRLNSSH